MEQRPYEMIVVFKDKKSRTFTLYSEVDPMDNISTEWNKPTNKILVIGPYMFSSENILYIYVKGDKNLEESTGKQLPDKGTKE